MSQTLYSKCPRCNASGFFDEEAQICNECEWGLDPEPEQSPSDQFRANVSSKQDCQNAAATLHSKLSKQLEETDEDSVLVTVKLLSEENLEGR